MVAAILGSAFAESFPASFDIVEERVETAYGEQRVYRVTGDGIDTAGKRSAYVLFRHGLPHEKLPNQINYRAQAAALHELGCEALLVTSSVGVLDADVPLYMPLIVGDLVMLDNRLPDGSACTMFPRPTDDHGHLIVNDSLFATDLRSQLRDLARAESIDVSDEPVVFAYVQGPRSKTPAENRVWPRLGAQVNSMTLGPEIVLANELEISSAALVVGHKYSVPGLNPPDDDALGDTLDRSRTAQEQIVTAFLQRGEGVPFPNSIYRF